MIITTFDCNTSLIINIGNTEIYCIDCTLLKNTNTGIYDTGTLTKAKWDIDCSIGNPFEKDDDSIMIIKLLLSYIKDRYPSVKYLLFTDMSTKTCDDGSSVNLAGMKVFTDGETWYETHFDVKMEEPYKNQYNTMKKYATEKKQEMSFESFIGYININNLPLSIDNLKEHYNNSKTWQEIFSYIRDKIGIFKYCIWLSNNNWFDNFIRIVLKFNILSLEFIFEPKQYDITYTIVQNIGGRHFTLRKRL